MGVAAGRLGGEGVWSVTIAEAAMRIKIDMMLKATGGELRREVYSAMRWGA